MKKTILFISLIFFAFQLWSQNDKIVTYFSRPVNNTVSSGTNAIYLNQLIDDTLIAYINRAKYTLDFAIYSFNETAAISSISTAINNAYARGVAIRWIYDGSSSNPSLPLLNSEIKTLASPTSALYGIMHNKFMVIDANSTLETDPIVWTGSTNFTAAQINTDANNVIIIQDKNVALAYTDEFNEMWGGTDLVPNSANSKFGPYKTDNTNHIFDVNGTTVEVYFSPSDGTNSKLQKAIGTANVDLYFGIYSFTVAADADSIINRIQNGVYAAGIIDPTSQSYPPYINLGAVMGTNLIKDNITGLYHNKMLIVDPSLPASDPMVFTGSHNWSASADTKNDENVVIVHDATVANIYYQSFYQNFIDEGGSLVIQTGISTPVSSSQNSIYPNPCNETTTIKIGESSMGLNPGIAVYDILGNRILPSISKNNDSFVLDTRSLTMGLYFVEVKTGEGVQVMKLQVVR
jgi:phosphatidylserine/phosphatidylglycerophosphate/cardiolipin synthase-like enzyme